MNGFESFFAYFREIFLKFMSDLGRFFYKGIVSPWTDVSGNFSSYGAILSSYSTNFGFWGWFLYVLSWLISIGLIGGIAYLLFILIRKYVRFSKRELEKEALKTQVEKLQYDLYQAIQEKDKILNLKVGYMGFKDNESRKEENVDTSNVRFPKLVNVDVRYKDVDTTIEPIQGLSLEEICNLFRNFAASKLQLYYSINTIRQLFAGMGTSKLIILEGISGTGKTSMAYALGKFFSYDAEIIPVQPSWKDRSELLGYYNEFTKKFNESEFLRALYTSTYRHELNVIVLDEMNLARIEYYFAEFLSIMEMRDKDAWVIDLIPSLLEGDPDHLTDGKLLIPQNAIFFGTANNDDSTFTISDKVYDRAISLFFDDKGRPFEAMEQEAIHMPYTQLESLYEEALRQYPVSQALLDKFDQLDNFVIKKFKLAFGNRILKQLNSFVPIYVATGGSEIDGFDFIFTNKILKKFESLNIGFLKDSLKELNNQLDKLFGKNTFPMAHRYIEDMINNN